MIKIEVNEGKLPWVIGVGTVLVGIAIGIICLRYPASSAKAAVAACLTVILIILSGIWFCLDGRNRKLTVEDMNICYSNWYGKKKTFSLDEIGYCRTAFGRERGHQSNINMDYLIVYDLHGKKLCKLEYNMKGSILFLQYLLDNKVKVEYSEKSDSFLRSMIQTTSICQEEIPAAVNDVYEAIKKLTWEWVQQNKKFDAEWKTGIAAYLEQEIVEGRQMWEQKGYSLPISGETKGEHQEKLPEGCYIVIEGYLLKDGEYVISKINKAVSIVSPVIHVTKSMRVGEEYVIRLFPDAVESWSQQLAFMSHELPKNKFHTEELVLAHELQERV